MSEHRYGYHIFWSAEDDCYIAQLTEFPSLSAFGDTPADALREAEGVLETTIELYESEGWELPEPRWEPEPLTRAGKAVSQTASNLALAIMQKRLDDGKSIEKRETPRMNTQTHKGHKLRRAIDARAYRGMVDTDPDLLDGLTDLIQDGQSPDQVYQWVLTEYGEHKQALALWCRSVARHITERVTA